MIIFLFILIRCDTEKVNDVNTNNDFFTKDTTIELIINFKRKTFIVSKDLKLKISQFQDFLNKYPLVPSFFVDTINVDIDYNGTNDLVITKIETLKGNSVIYSTVIMNNNLALQDTLKPADELSFMDWANDSIYYKLKPYSSFYDAIFAKNRIDEIENGIINDDLISFFIQNKSFEYEKNGLDSLQIKIKTDSIINELHNYKGKFVTTLEDWDRSLLIWNKYTNMFECLYSP